MADALNISSNSDTSTISIENLKTLQFEWLARLSRMSGLASLVINSDMKIVFYEDRLLAMMEYENHVDLHGVSLITLLKRLAQRGDFGPGDQAIFCDLIASEIRRDPKPSERKSLSLITPKGRRLKFSQDSDMDGYYLLTCRDITESYIKRHALKIALDSSLSGYIIYHVESQKYELHGDIGKKALGDTLSKRLLEEGLSGILHKQDAPRVYARWNSGLESKKPWDMTFKVNDPESKQTRWIKCQATPQIAENGDVRTVIIFYSDVSAQLRVQDDLRKAGESAEKSLSAKNNFLGRLSHEIRTPMNAVVGIADALIYHNGDPKILPKLELIQSSAEKIIHIVDESLEHTKLAESKLVLDPISASPEEAVRSACSLWEQKALKNDIDLSCKVDPSVPEEIIFDPHRFEQCLNNLLSNAVKFSPGGKINVVLTTIGEAPSARLILAVKDTGIGMNEAQLESLFEAFTQADKSIAGRFGGTGLGMNITKQIIELMGGTISAKSESGQGTVIAISLPIVENRRMADRREDSTNALINDMLEKSVPAKTDYSNLRVLVVDDNTTNHMVVISLIDTLVSHIDTAENGVEAIEKLKTNDYDVVLMDIHMPIMDGIEATLAIRASSEPFKNMPIIALTADPQYQQRRLCKNIGMDDALAKPVRLTELLAAIDRITHKTNAEEIAA